ncbi:MAG: hypothetical protein AAF919_04260 [Pseudomonadota bacterium]
MTVLDGIARLETAALWTPEDAEAPRAVFVSIGEAELTIEDNDGIALSHWSLPALERLNPGILPARYAPALGAAETLEIEEAEMVAALERVRDAVETGRRPKGRLRRIALGLTLGIGLGLILTSIPGALRNHAATIMPQPARFAIGERVRTEIVVRTGPICAGVLGTEALDRLRTRLLPTRPAELSVIRGLPSTVIALPGGLFLLSDDILLAQDDPDVAAGHLLAAATQTQSGKPLARFLADLPLTRLVGLLATGGVTDEAITRHAEDLLSAPRALPDDAALRGAFTTARLAWAPYAEATGRPMGDAAISPPAPALEEAEWQMLGTICDG